MKITALGDGDWITFIEAAQLSGLSYSRIRKLAAEGVIPSRDWPVNGTRLVVTVLDKRLFEEWFKSNGRNRKLQYVIEVSGADFDEVHAFLDAKGISMRRRTKNKSNADMPFADLAAAETPVDSIDLGALLEAEAKADIAAWRSRKDEEDE